MKRLKQAVADGGNDPAKVKANVIAAMNEIARILGDGVSIVTGKPLKQMNQQKYAKRNRTSFAKVGTNSCACSRGPDT
ncbi:MAG: hypothetical protein NTY15_08990 [Planctomycetota bacterium]|nr:hypothetical protein [Planctomycetota bacterium]